MALVTLMAIYPLVLLAQILLAPRLLWLPLPARVLVVSGTMVTLMTWLVMPFLVRLFKPWLFRPKP
jgi:antibiotic biosynthesis monooxygenase (ABM) superfamily enzyme